MFDCSANSVCVFPFFFGSNIDFIDRRNSVKAQSAVCVQPSVDLTSRKGFHKVASIPSLAIDGPMGTSSTEAGWLQTEPLCLSNPAESFFAHLCWSLRRLAHSPGGGRALNTSGSNLVLLADVHTGLRVRFSGPAELSRGEVLGFAVLCGLPSFWQERGLMCVVRGGSEPCLPGSAWGLAQPQASKLFSLPRP